MVGPLRLNYGIVVAAGTILRKDELRPNRLIYGGAGKAGNIAVRVGRFSDASRIVINNLAYIANLIALRHWYREVRALFIGVDFPQALLEGLLLVVHSAVSERMRRLKELADKLKAAGNPALADAWQEIEEEIEAQMENGGDPKLRDSFKEKLLTVIAQAGKDYIGAIQSLKAEESGQGTAWLQGIVDNAVDAALKKFKV